MWWSFYSHVEHLHDRISSPRGEIWANKTWLNIWVTRRVSFKMHELLTLLEHLSSTPGFFVRSVLLIILGFFVLFYYVSTFWCSLRFRIKTIFASSLPPIVCKRAYVLSMFAWVKWCPTHTVKPVYKGQSWEPENVAFMSSCPLYTG